MKPQNISLDLLSCPLTRSQIVLLNVGTGLRYDFDGS